VNVPAWVNRPQWVDLVAPMQTDAESRKAQEYVDVCRQFEVEHAWRYLPRNGATYCNIYVTDCTSALGCKIPHWYDPDTGKPARFGMGAEMSANAMCDWLKAGHGEWQHMERRDAVARANLGFPAVATHRNPRGHGHVAMLLPGELIAQAGAACLFMVPIARGFGTLEPVFYSHN